MVPFGLMGATSPRELPEIEGHGLGMHVMVQMGGCNARVHSSVDKKIKRGLLIVVFGMLAEVLGL